MIVRIENQTQSRSNHKSQPELSAAEDRRRSADLLPKLQMSASNGDFRLRRWRSPAVNLFPAIPDSNIREEYTSIRDLIVSSPRSCGASPTAVGSEIQIRNPLVKQAVYAYLQLTPSCTESNNSSSPNWISPLRRIMAAISASFRPLRRCVGIIAGMLCCGNSGDLR